MLRQLPCYRLSCLRSVYALLSDSSDRSDPSDKREERALSANQSLFAAGDPQQQKCPGVDRQGFQIVDFLIIP